MSSRMSKVRRERARNVKVARRKRAEAAGSTGG